MKMTLPELRTRLEKWREYDPKGYSHTQFIDIVFVDTDILGLMAYISIPWNEFEAQFEFFRQEFKDVPWLDIEVPEVVITHADRIWFEELLFDNAVLPFEVEVIGVTTATLPYGDKFPVLIIKLPPGWEPDNDRFFVFSPDGRILR